MRNPGRHLRRVLAGSVSAACLAAAAPAMAGVAPDRAMGHVFDWGHELNQEEHPRWNPGKAPLFPPARWYRTVNSMLGRSGANGLWFSGFAALPFDIPVHPKEPAAWRNRSNFLRQYRRTGLSWDLNVEARAAKNALKKKSTVIVNSSTKAPTRRMSLLDPEYRRAALAEIRRLVPGHARLPYVHAYTGSDEPIVILPRGRKALASPYAKRLARDVKRRFGFAPPSAAARPTRSAREGLKWLAYSRHVSDRFFAMKREQARLIRRLDRNALVVPNDYGMIDGFMPWDYTRLSRFADIVEADPYVSFAEAASPGRGRYNPGFGAKLMSDLSGKPVRIIVQAFEYSGYLPEPDDLDVWTGQALRAGATHISFYALGNPRFTNRPLYERIVDLAKRLKGTRLPAPPVDPATVVVYATASEGQGQPHRSGDARYRTSGDEIYTAYSFLGELGKAAFTFDSDTRLVAQKSRLDRARTVWLPRGDTLDRAFADRLAQWVRAGGTLVVTDPEAFTRAPSGASLSGVRDELIGAPLGPRRSGGILLSEPGALGPTVAEPLALPIDAQERHAFAAVPAGATVLARFLDGAPAAFSRPVGTGRVIAFSAEIMSPSVLEQPMDLGRFVSGIHASTGGRAGHPAWDYAVPGAPADRAPWTAP